MTDRESPETAALYDELFTNGEYEEHRRQYEALQRGQPAWGYYHAYMLNRIERKVAGRELVEIGGGTGAFGYLARRRGWHYTDFDVSPAAVEFVTKLGLNAHVFSPGTAPPLPLQATDVVVMWEVLEHVWDVSQYLGAIRRALRPGGLLVMSTPNWEFQKRQKAWGALSSPPIHCNFFNSVGIRHVLSRHGFSRVAIDRKRFYRPVLAWPSIVFSVKQFTRLQPAATLAVFASVDIEDTSGTSVWRG